MRTTAFSDTQKNDWPIPIKARESGTSASAPAELTLFTGFQIDSECFPPTRVPPRRPPSG